MNSDTIRQSQSGLAFQLHPLVFINISDHNTRERANTSGASTSSSSVAPIRVVGCLLGQQSGRTIDISNSFEVNLAEDGFSLDHPLVIKKMEQYKQTFPQLDIVGWYATGSTITATTDMEAHRKIMDINESPVFLLLDADLKTQTKGNMLPITLYESELHVQDGTTVFQFVSSDFTIATSEAERIGVDQVARIVPSTGSFAGSTQLTSQLNSMHSAVTMLVDRVAALHALLIKMQSGEVPFDHEIVRHAAALSARLPAIDSQQFETSYNAQFNDTLITILLASLTKVNASQSGLIEKSNDAFQRISSMIKRGGKGGTAPQPAERMERMGGGGHHYQGASGMMML